MTQDELNLVLDALKFCHGGEPCGTAEAIAVVEKTLAQLEQEPVGQLLEDVFGRGQVMWFNKPKDESMLYTTPPQPEQEPVAWMYVNTDGECEQIEYGEPFDDPSTTPLYTAPPQRTEKKI